MVSHHEDIFNNGGLIQLHRGLHTSVMEMHKLQQSIRSNRTKGSPWHFFLKCLAVQASPYYSLAILHHNEPPKSFLGETQCPLLALMAGILVYPIKHHVVLSHGDDEGYHSLVLAFWGRVDVHQTLIQYKTIADAEEHLALLRLGFCSQTLFEESISSGWQHALSEVKPLAACH